MNHDARDGHAPAGCTADRLLHLLARQRPARVDELLRMYDRGRSDVAREEYDRGFRAGVLRTYRRRGLGSVALVIGGVAAGWALRWWF